MTCPSVRTLSIRMLPFGPRVRGLRRHGPCVGHLVSGRPRHLVSGRPPVETTGEDATELGREGKTVSAPGAPFACCVSLGSGNP